MFALQQRIIKSTGSSWTDALYVHASNGFYIDSIIRRVVRPLFS
jgi:hypothetical protein